MRSWIKVYIKFLRLKVTSEFSVFLKKNSMTWGRSFSSNFFFNTDKVLDQQSVIGCILIISEPPHDKTNKMTCAPSEDSDQTGRMDQPGRLLSLIRVFATCMKEEPWVLSYLMSASEDSDQTGWVPRLIWVFAGCTGHFVGFVMCRLICGWKESHKKGTFGG